MSETSYSKIIMVTGGAGFIGSNLLLRLVPKYPNYFFVNVDLLTYAGNLANVESLRQVSNYCFEQADITNEEQIHSLFGRYKFTHVLHLAAESHVDRSIKDPLAFVRTNVLGTVNLLNEALCAWQGEDREHLFYHISTDEVYGSLAPTDDPFTEKTPYSPRSPYSASKASSDHFVRAYHHTYGLPVVLSNCSNNYGPYQFPEKLIPLCINNIIHQRPLPIYGDGMQIRDWLYVTDHVDAIDMILHRGEVGETYNIGGQNECTNISIVKQLISLVDQQLGRPRGHSLSLITHVADRLGHDTRYAIDPQKLSLLGYTPKMTLEQGLQSTVAWYINHKEWLGRIISGEYQRYY